MKTRHIHDLTNQRFGKLVALYPTAKRLRRSTIWHCRCDCGRVKDISANNLVQGSTRSCGCLQQGRRQNSDETGKTYGWLTVIARAPNSPFATSRWLCRCRCGRELVVDGAKLRQGHALSCGRHERMRKRI